MRYQYWLHAAIIVSSLFTQAACTSLGQDVTRSSTVPPNVETPGWESANRGIFLVNAGLDWAIVKPLARGYQAVTPEVVDESVTHFFGNLSDVKTSVNALLQFKPRAAVTSAGRVVVNSTLGLAGFFDVASKMNLKKYNEDFGQTLARWGVPSGPYVMLPFLGPSTLRDAVGTVADGFVDPLNYSKYPAQLTAVKVIDKRADLLSSEKALQDLSDDQYSALRDLWLQRRAYELRDGVEDKASAEKKDDMIDLLESLDE
ncbi:MlaA family lipoprotein [Leucothrix mucor]|uniref:MlaA family lipoprotein n=1 Tax=Leucothrix mucor TaxID=45248 RepID=UPI0003B6B1F8|nr:VacJ family lipoprotein [Leucothrix mucor]